MEILESSILTGGIMHQIKKALRSGFIVTMMCIVIAAMYLEMWWRGEI